MKFNTIIMSDIHLGTPDSKYQQVLDFLKKNTFKNLILNGDIIDGWHIKIFGKLPIEHRKLLHYIFGLAKNSKVNVYYIKGNHDEFLKRILPLEAGNFKLLKDLVYTGLNGKKYYICHGDQFDKVEGKLFILSLISFLGGCFLYRLNRIYNKRRLKKGRKYLSLVKQIKSIAKVMMVGGNNKFYPKLESTAKKQNCQGIICGHIHKAENLKIGNIHYLNSGDRVESMTAITEDLKGNREILNYNK
ncbi:UDP-2,3-diacylglucosamine diphosphatase [Candidatus Gracilibacteria bacterium]|nr:UDP-2,3-diacylglucosamine diphosphatase [Candidatus Gracilibacteria bacterium]